VMVVTLHTVNFVMGCFSPAIRRCVCITWSSSTSSTRTGRPYEPFRLAS
jgi:hypothetical protein